MPPSPLDSLWRLRLPGSFSMERSSERVSGLSLRFDVKGQARTTPKPGDGTTLELMGVFHPPTQNRRQRTPLRLRHLN